MTLAHLADWIAEVNEDRSWHELDALVESGVLA